MVPKPDGTRLSYYHDGLCDCITTTTAQICFHREFADSYVCIRSVMILLNGVYARARHNLFNLIIERIKYRHRGKCWNFLLDMKLLFVHDENDL